MELKPIFKAKVIIEKDGDIYYAHCPALKGLHVDGMTEEEALKNAKDAMIAYIASLIKHGEPIPICGEEEEHIKVYKKKSLSGTYPRIEECVTAIT